MELLGRLLDQQGEGGLSNALWFLWLASLWRRKGKVDRSGGLPLLSGSRCGRFVWGRTWLFNRERVCSEGESEMGGNRKGELPFG